MSCVSGTTSSWWVRARREIISSKGAPFEVLTHEPFRSWFNSSKKDEDGSRKLQGCVPKVERPMCAYPESLTRKERKQQGFDKYLPCGRLAIMDVPVARPVDGKYYYPDDIVGDDIWHPVC